MRFNQGFKKPLLVIGISAALFSTSTIAESQSSKPAGAMGSSAAVANQPKSNQFWWPDQLDLSSLRDHSSASNPYGADFDYAEKLFAEKIGASSCIK